jgi:hypothetical protein
MTIATLMFPPRLRVVDGGSQSSDALGVEPVGDCLGPWPHFLAASPARCVELAEAEAGRVADLLAPAIAVAFTAEAQLVQIAAADVAEAVRTRDAFREAAAAARVVLDVFQAAEARLLDAITAVPRGGLATP